MEGKESTHEYLFPYIEYSPEGLQRFEIPNIPGLFLTTYSMCPTTTWSSCPTLLDESLTRCMTYRSGPLTE